MSIIINEISLTLELRTGAFHACMICVYPLSVESSIPPHPPPPPLSPTPVPRRLEWLDFMGMCSYDNQYYNFPSSTIQDSQPNSTYYPFFFLICISSRPLSRSKITSLGGVKKRAIYRICALFVSQKATLDSGAQVKE